MKLISYKSKIFVVNNIKLKYIYVLGEHQIEQFDLKPYPSGYNKKYDEAMDPTISNVFAAAAFKSAFAKLSVSTILKQSCAVH